MNKDSKMKDSKSTDIDYFYLILKNWKTIFLSCLFFLLLGIAFLFFSPKLHTAKATFSVALKNEINTAYGIYELKTINPINYLTVIEQNQFKNNVLEKTGNLSTSGVSFEVEEEKLAFDPKSSDQATPNKFDLIVTGTDKEKLVEISSVALSTFLENTDNNFKNDIFNKFSSELKIKIDNLQFDIQIKEKLITDLNEALDKTQNITSDKSNLNELYDNRLINNLEGSERGMVISMMLNGGKGSQYYYKSVISYEEVQLKLLSTELGRQKLLLSKLIENNENGTLSNLFNLPFSSNYYLLTSPEVKQISSFSSNLKRLLIFIFIGFFISTSVVLVRSYYVLKSK